MHNLMTSSVAQLGNKIGHGDGKQSLKPTCALARRTDAKSEGYPTLLKMEVCGDRSNIQGVAPLKQHDRRAQSELQTVPAQRKGHPRAEKTSICDRKKEIRKKKPDNDTQQQSRQRCNSP